MERQIYKNGKNLPKSSVKTILRIKIIQVGIQTAIFILKIKDKTVKFPDNTLYKGYNGFFENFQGRIELAKIDTSNVVDMYSMFFGITGGNLNVDNWNTSNVTDMALMFYTATDLTPDVSGWNTSKVKDMSFMFSEVTFDPDVSD